ncbi:MAG: BTAD domain-containing putative transcriptional regulator [Nitrospiraceae bacterium]|nr:BTAD domain-containing putative transcriptional regulator [Nitrospiraceae bacterium]
MDDCRCDRPVVWISAPAGSGKTTLVSSYIEHSGLPCLWYQIDERDGDIASFFSSMGQAIKRARPAFHTPMPHFTPEYALGIPAFSKNWFEEMYRRLKPPFVIVLDNYQDASDESKLHEVMASALSVMPGDLNLFVISRRDPHPRLSRFRANGLINSIGWDEMRFTLGETKEVVRTRSNGRKNSLPESSVGLLHSKTDGWIAGVILMLERMRVHGIPQALDAQAMQSGVFDYFANEFFEGAGKDLLNFLIKTAFLTGISAEIAGKLAGTEEAGAILEELTRENYFTTKYPGRKATYQYHPLFRDFLRHRAEARLSADELIQLKKNTANLLATSGQTENAVELFLEAMDWGESVKLILASARSLIEQGRHAVLEKWIDAFPPELLDNTAWLLYWKGICRIPVGPDEGLTLFERAFHLFSKSNEETGELLAWSGIVETLILLWDDLKPLDQWIDWFDKRQERSLSFPSVEVEALVTCSMAGALVWKRPGYPGIEDWLKRSLALAKKSGNAELHLRAFYNAMRYYGWIMGDIGVSRILADEVKRTSGHSAPLYQIGIMATEAYFDSMAGDPKTPIKLVSEGFDLAEKTGVHVMDFYLAHNGVIGAAIKNDIPLMKQYVEKMRTYLVPGRLCPESLYLHLSSWLRLLQGNMPEARELAKKSVEMCREAGFQPGEAWCLLVYAWALFEIGELDKAEKELFKMEGFINEIGSLLLSLAHGYTKAYFAGKRGEEETCLNFLNKTLTAGRKSGYFLVIMAVPRFIWSYLCPKALEAGMEVEYTRGIVKKLGVIPAGYDENWPWPLKIYTLGGFRIEKEGKPLVFSGKLQQKPLALLKAVIAFGINGISEEQLTDMLWPDAEGDAAHSSFKMALSRLRQLIGNGDAVLLTNGQVTLDTRQCWVDAWAFERMAGRKDAERLQPGNDKEVLKIAETVEKALSLYKGGLFPADTGSVWIEAARERLQKKYLHLVQELARIWEKSGADEKAASCYEAALDKDPLAEELYQLLMACYQRLGRYSEAVAAYNRCRKILAAELGTRPSAKTESLYRSIAPKEKQ